MSMVSVANGRIFIRKLMHYMISSHGKYPYVNTKMTGFPSHFQVIAQNYEVAGIKCSFGKSILGGGDLNDQPASAEQVTAKVRKPEGFKGTPIFADDRKIDPFTDESCHIRPDPTDLTGHMYNLKITDLNKCGVLVKNVSCIG